MPVEQMFNERCNEHSNNKIAVLTYQMGGTGWNLQRASMAVLLDVPPSPADRHQACNRVTRRGQTGKPHIVEMYYRNHMGEDQQKRINDGIKATEIDWKNTEWLVVGERKARKRRMERRTTGKRMAVAKTQVIAKAQVLAATCNSFPHNRPHPGRRVEVSSCPTKQEQ